MFSGWERDVESGALQRHFLRGLSSQSAPLSRRRFQLFVLLGLEHVSALLPLLHGESPRTRPVGQIQSRWASALHRHR